MSERTQQDIEEHLRDLEEMVASLEVRSSPQELGPLIAHDIVEFGKSGRIYDKKRALAVFTNDDPQAGHSIEVFAVERQEADTAPVTYRILPRASLPGSLSSSIRVRRDDGWQMLFHRGTAT